MQIGQSSQAYSRQADLVLKADKAGCTTSLAYRRYVLALLVAVGIVAWIDRNILSVVLQSIKVEMGFSDLQLGLLGGAAFGLFYATLGLPVAWLADRYGRSIVLSGAIAIWSGMTALCGMATGFVSLFLARVGVGIGEAGAAPPSHALVADYFPQEERGFALGVLYLYIPLGSLVGFWSAGWLDEALGWRLAFVVVGLPGVLLALLVRLTLREPPTSARELNKRLTPPSLVSTVAYFWRRRSLRHLPIAGAIHGIGAVAASVWLPSYLIRVHGMTSGEAGAWMAVTYGIGGGAGVLLGGAIADALARQTNDHRWYPWTCAVALSLTVPIAVTAYLSDSPARAVALFTVSAVFGHAHLGPIVATIQNLAGSDRRAVSAALFLFLVNFVSTTIGPAVVGAASDSLSSTFGVDALRYSLLIVVNSTTILAVVHLILASLSLHRDLSNVDGEVLTASHTRPPSISGRSR